MIDTQVQSFKSPEGRQHSVAGAGFRRTISREARLSGIGLHSGETVNLWLAPAPAGTGLVFRSTTPDQGDIAVSPFNVIDTVNAVTLGNRRWKVQTVEHLLAALAALSITDLYMTLDSFEAPILDGSSAGFYEALTGAGVVDLDERLEPIRLQTAAWVVDGDKYLVALPHDGLRVTYSIDFNHPLLRAKTIQIDLDGDALAREILPARTFGFLRDVEAMRARGLIKGASIDNAVVLTEDGYLNDSLRFEEECVRHKILDLIGDLYLLGRPLHAHLIASRAGHTLDAALARKIYTQAAMDELSRRKEDRRGR
jgi:UDP-3-O-[3-hydroxymyristoyl] N-acetylglucosamine deacetylase